MIVQIRLVLFAAGDTERNVVEFADLEMQEKIMWRRLPFT